MIEQLPPALVLLLAAVLIGLVRGYLRDAVVLLAPLFGEGATSPFTRYW